MNTNSDKKYLTKHECADILGVSESTIQRLLSKRLFTYIRPSHKVVRIVANDFYRYCAEATVGKINRYGYER
jgi:transcriptional regulator with XRE-family HTH domain